MPNENIEYKSKQILEFYSRNRRKWKELNLSERWVFERLAGREKNLGDVLDVGCACGGLGTALNEKFTLSSYTGVDIHKDAINWARRKSRLDIPTTYFSGDIVKQELSMDYDTVVSLSSADWNIRTNEIIESCWNRVKPSRFFVISLRLTPEEGINNIKKSYQLINFSGDEKKPEIANYVVFNLGEALKWIRELYPPPDLIGAYGYWGVPSPTAVTPFMKLIFAVFYIKKKNRNSYQKIETEFRLPIEVFL